MVDVVENDFMRSLTLKGPGFRPGLSVNNNASSLL